MPSVSPSVTVSCLFPQPAANSAHTSAAEMTSRRLMAGILDARDRDARAAIVVLLEDRLQPLQRLAAAALEPAARAAEALHDAVGRQRGLAFGGVLDLRAVAGRRQRPGRVGLVAVELPAAARGDDPERPLDLDEGHVLPAESVEALVAAEAGAGAGAHGVDPRQAPVLEVVVAELRVVRDVREVVEDLLARTADGDLAGDGVHGGRESNRRAAGGRFRRPWCEACSRASPCGGARRSARPLSHAAARAADGGSAGTRRALRT